MARNRGRPQEEEKKRPVPSKKKTPLPPYLLVVVSRALREPVEALAPRLAVGVDQRHEPLVGLDSRDDVLIVEALHDRLAGRGRLVERLLEEDRARDEVAEVGRGHEQLAVGQAVGLGVLHADGVEALAAGGVGLVHGEDAVALGGDLVLLRGGKGKRGGGRETRKGRERRERVRKKKRKIHACGAATPFRIEVLPLAASFLLPISSSRQLAGRKCCFPASSFCFMAKNRLEPRDNAKEQRKKREKSQCEREAKTRCLTTAENGPS